MVEPATQEPVGSLATALAHTRRLLAARPDLAEVQAREILAQVRHPEAELLLGVALRLQGDLAGARAVLVPLAAVQPRATEVHYEAGVVLGALGETRPAVAALTRATELNPKAPHAWRALGDQLTVLGETTAADAAYARQIQASVNDPVLMEAAQALVEGKLAVVEHLLRGFLKAHPTDVVAMRMLAEAGTRLGRYGDVEKILQTCLELAPSFIPARYNYAIVLYRQNRAAEALPQIEKLLADEPGNIGYRNLHAAALSLVGEYAQAIAIYEEVLKAAPEQPLIWLSYGHALRTSGRQAEAVSAYKRAIEQMPGLGEAYFSLANLKTVRFDSADIEAMRTQLQRPELSSSDQLHLHYALGKALEDEGDYAASFDHYAKGAALRRAETPYDAEEMTARRQRSQALFTKDFFAGRVGWGCDAPDPIFVVGLPRSGSTLIEQILSSHSAVEGTMELPDINAIALSLGHNAPKKKDRNYPASLAELEADQLRALGEEYLTRTRIQRKTGRPLFIDKMPNNFQHVGLIHLILPGAKIIDARRHPLATCFSAFKQHFAKGQNYTYDLDELGRYYRDYVALMDHFDEVLPGRIHRVYYERMVEDQEAEVRRLLDYCGLPFEDACLRFYENERAVRTASSEQVRRPIFREGLDQWRRYEPWLGPLKDVLGPVLEAYPQPLARVEAPPSK
ncbi:tetratricopeptide repeat-containing sulfotransferase family protein [Phenylobacterium montanum]|uniref:Sulfotransferase n=1 Tax=Phenylobacterium montanum TaxID=2823693 RepID=A0A975FY77_9CAUL|nr:tetratricopeptide repeat-containing sulfotransferase family protein [Caulobacter sp. S6]QUD87394.1 sulfotransferase [Caulobacter sp. S6]